MSSWSLPIAARPFAASTPMTSQENCFTRTCSPSTSVLPKSSRRTVSPITHTAAPAFSSFSSKPRPEASTQLLVWKYALVVPVMLVAQLRPLAITVTPARCSGATALMPPICVRMASASDSLNAAAPAAPMPGPRRCPGRTISRLLPRLEIWSLTACVAPLPSVTIVITAPTPMTIPRIVRNERIRLRRISRSASRIVLNSIRPSPPRRPRTRPACAPGCARRARCGRRRRARCARRTRPSRDRA